MIVAFELHDVALVKHRQRCGVVVIADQAQERFAGGRILNKHAGAVVADGLNGLVDAVAFREFQAKPEILVEQLLRGGFVTHKIETIRRPAQYLHAQPIDPVRGVEPHARKSRIADPGQIRLPRTRHAPPRLDGTHLVRPGLDIGVERRDAPIVDQREQTAIGGLRRAAQQFQQRVGLLICLAHADVQIALQAAFLFLAAEQVGGVDIHRWLDVTLPDHAVRSPARSSRYASTGPRHKPACSVMLYQYPMVTLPPLPSAASSRAMAHTRRANASSICSTCSMGMPPRRNAR